MEIGLGLDGTLGLSLSEEAELSTEAARLGYASIWTPEGTGYDSFQICAYRWAASKTVVSGGLGTGISVSPVALRTPISLAMSAGTMTALTGGRFVLGIGSGAIHRPAGRRTFGMGPGSTLDVMRDYVGTVRRLLAGETVTHAGPAASLARRVARDRSAASHPCLPRRARPEDARARRGARRRPRPQLVHPRSGRVESRAHSRRRGRGGPRPRRGEGWPSTSGSASTTTWTRRGGRWPGRPWATRWGPGARPSETAGWGTGRTSSAWASPRRSPDSTPCGTAAPRPTRWPTRCRPTSCGVSATSDRPTGRRRSSAGWPAASTPPSFASSRRGRASTRPLP